MRLILALVLVACGGCRKSCPVKKPIAPPIEVITTRVDCPIKPPPLEPESFGFLEEGCPKDVVCLTEDALRQLIIYISDLQKYARTAWTQCGPTPTKEKTP